MGDGLYNCFDNRVGFRVYPREHLLKRNFDKELERLNGNGKYPEITIGTLFCGRFHALAPYMWSLGNLDYDKKKIHLIFYCSASNKFFFNELRKVANRIKKEYASLKLVHDDTIAPSKLAFAEKLRDNDIPLHLDNIPKLYTKLFALADTKYVFSFEDDQINPSHIIKRFLKIIRLRDVASVAGVAFCRHTQDMVGYDFYLDPLDDRIKGVPINSTTGRRFCITPVGSAGFGATIFDNDVLKRTSMLQSVAEAPDLLGVDVCFGYQVNKMGKGVLYDWDIHSYHLNSQSEIR